MKTILLTFVFILSFFFWVVAQKTDFYVSPSGKDSNPGTISQPFATLEKARQAIDIISGKGLVEVPQFTVLLRGGTYHFEQSVVFSDLEIINSVRTITIKNFAEEKVVFSGGIRLPVSSFCLVKDKETLNRLRPEAKDKVVVFDLKANNIPYDSALIQQGFGHKIRSSSCTLYFNKELLPLARWPNEGKLPIGTVIDPGSKPRWDDPPYRGAIFKYDYDRAANWTKANDVWIYGVFANGFSDDNLKVESFNQKGKTLKTVQPHTYGVFSSTDTSTWDITHARQLRGYYVYNLLEEIDLPGEYFLDRKTGKLYLWPPNNLENAEIELTELTEPFLVFYNTSKISVSGIQFECSRGMGIYLNYADGINIENCVFRNLSLLGISIGESYGSLTLPSLKKKIVDSQIQNQNNRIENCTIYNTGSGGIYLEGGDRVNLVSGNNTITNCEIHGYSKIQKAGVAAIALKGVGNSVSHCYIHDAPHMAIQLWGNNHLIEYNHIQNVCTNTSDAGAVYAGRNPSALGTIIRYNFFDSIIQPENLVCAIYLDDGTCGYKVTDNIFYRCGNPEKFGNGFGTFHINGGYGNYMDNNLFIECKRAYGGTSWTDKKWIEYLTKGVVPVRLKEVNIDSDIYQEAYPMLKSLRDTLTLPPRFNYTSNDLLVRCGEFAKGSYQHKAYWETNDDPGFVDFKNKDFTLKIDSEALNKYPGFRTIPFKEIGLMKQRLTR